MAKANPLAGIRLFAGLDDGQLARIADAGEHVEYELGDTIFEEGDAGTRLCCLIDGRVEISVALGGATEQVPVHTATAGSVFGEFVLFETAPRSATVRATKPAKVLAIEAEALRAIFAADPKAGYRTLDNLCRILVDRMRKTTRELRSSLMW
jgi:CRP-like cAMP-binding protein